jgi:outer membrane protein OmpA-like peptidoglycan-associated protein
MVKSYSCALILLAGTVLSARSSPQQPDNDPLPKGYYIVVAAFFSHQEDYAQRYAAKLNENGLHAKYGLEPTRKLYFVYLDQYSDFTESVRQMLRVRKSGTFEKAWVRTIRTGPETSEHIANKEEPQLQKVNPPLTPVVKKEEPKIAGAKKTEEVNATEKKVEEQKSVVTEVIENPPADPVYLPQSLSNTPVFLSLYNATNNQVIDGDVEVVDTERSRLITKVKGNTYVTLPNPGTKSGQLSLISKTFGFRPEQHELHYQNTEADTVQPYLDLVGNFYMVNFGLSRIHKGDISTLYNVYFYNDAAIMLPDSKYQLNSLLQMFKENPSLKIVLHGHTNGNSRGKIIYMGPSKDFFKITKDAVEGSGSAKELSEARAEVIREWLLAQGIANERVTVKGWGGSRMIHDKNSVHARKNIRVDVEVIEE